MHQEIKLDSFLECILKYPNRVGVVFDNILLLDKHSKNFIKGGREFSKLSQVVLVGMLLVA